MRFKLHTITDIGNGFLVEIFEAKNGTERKYETHLRRPSGKCEQLMQHDKLSQAFRRVAGLAEEKEQGRIK